MVNTWFGSIQESNYGVLIVAPPTIGLCHHVYPIVNDDDACCHVSILLQLGKYARVRAKLFHRTLGAILICSYAESLAESSFISN